MIRIIDKKTLYNIDNNIPASVWIREKITNIKTIDAPQMKSGLRIKTDGKTMSGRIVPGALGYIFNGGNNVDSNGINVALFTSCYAMGHGVSILPINFERCVSLFSARKLIQANWINCFDEYLAPDESNPNYEEFVNDSIIFSLFHIHSNSASLRNMEYKNKKWDIKNEFFWMSKTEIALLAKDNNNEDCYDDAMTSDDRYVYKYLQKITLSPEAQAVLDYANKLVRESFKYREKFNKDHPEYQINNWDCGYYQLKALWKEYMPEEFAEFRSLYNKLADKMRPMVYELGFLKK